MQRSYRLRKLVRAIWSNRSICQCFLPIVDIATSRLLASLPDTSTSPNTIDYFVRKNSLLDFSCSACSCNIVGVRVIALLSM